MRYKYTERELEELLKSIIVITDTREQANGHIISYLEGQGIAHKAEALKCGDYSCILPANQELGIMRDTYFNNIITIERKGSLEELAGNFTKERSRIESEFLRAKGKIILMIEGATYGDILHHRYKSKYSPQAFIGTLKAFEARYGINTAFIDKKYAGNFLYYTLKHYVREALIS